jgi:hypothetical protein
VGKPTLLGVVASIVLFGMALRADSKLAWIFGVALLAVLLDWVWNRLRKQR